MRDNDEIVKDSTEEIEYHSSFASRAGALYYDIVILNVCLYTIRKLLNLDTNILDDIFRFSVIKHDLYNTIFFFIAFLIYMSIMESSSKKATLGKLLFDIVIIDIQGNKITFWKALWRNLLKFFTIFFLGLGFLTAILSKRKQTIYDMPLNTTVINKRFDKKEYYSIGH